LHDPRRRTRHSLEHQHVQRTRGFGLDEARRVIGRGASHRPAVKDAVKAGLVFGVIEAITPLIGWGLGIIAAGLVEKVDHWIAFTLLLIVGGKMIWIEGVQPRGTDEDEAPRRSGPWALVATAVGTSIDAAAVGVGLAFIGANIWVIAASIGFTTFVGG
jgi:manganese efflux pump family protein